MDINDAWKDTCRVLLSEEVGELGEFGPYLSKYVEKPQERISMLSKAPIMVSSAHFGPKTRFISNDEMARYQKIARAPLNINEVKDLDSLLGALSERFVYSGNIVVGNSSEVNQSDSCANSQFVHRSIRVFDSKFVAFSSDVRYGECIFGSDKVPASKFLISSSNTHKSIRCMECISIMICADCYYSAHLEDCQNCLFSFNQKNKSYLVGNLAFARDEFASIKAKLLADMASLLRTKKSVLPLVDLIRDAHA